MTKTMNKNQEEMKNTIPEMKNTLKGIKNRLTEAEDRSSKLEDKAERNTQNNKMKKTKRNEDSLWELQDSIKHNNIHIIGISQGEVKEQWIKNN